ncbi:MAG: SH3 domain-containing protein [Clostridia bacterium]|nr:SH3 domain-containing protein [Clostridia bacterium]
MTKRTIALILVLSSLLGVCLPLAASADDGSRMYVYTDNGKTLNVRRDPSTSADVIGKLAFGEAVSVRLTMANGWAVIDWAAGDGFVAYVQSRFLVTWKPSGTPAPAAPASGTPAASDSRSILNEMNAEFRAGRRVAVPYVVVARPSRASGWVNLRWAPSLEAERIATCPQGKELIVQAELKTWYQVQDPVTGMIGFISKKYVTVR